MTASHQLHGPGDLIGDRYEVLDFIGEGGMQQVYRAQDKTLDRVVALKCPKNASAERRFKRSATFSARINHPNAAATLDYVDDTERPYLIEEFIEGVDLKRYRERLPIMDPYLVAHVMHHVARGVEASHNAGVVHRDLKPSNIMVAPGLSLDYIKVTDFGIAKMAEEEINLAVDGGDESMQSSKTMLGALAYMAPEQIDEPRSAGKAADVWSIGALLFRSLSNTKPYGEGLKVVRRIFTEEPAPFPAALRRPQFAGLVDEILALIARCMTKDVGARITAKDLREACDKLCYPEAHRASGTVDRMVYQTCGFIEPTGGGPSVFYHRNSVYGSSVRIGDLVCFAQYAGDPQERAHPVVKMA